MKRRPQQMSMLTLMQAAELDTRPPFAGCKIQRLVYDEEKNILAVVVVGPSCPTFEEESDEDPWWDQAAPEEDA